MTEPTTILAPLCLDELERLALLTDAADARSDVRYVGGGTLEVPRWQAEGAPRFGIALSGVRELAVRGAEVCGAASTLAQIASDPSLPRLLRTTAGACATPAVRSVGTLGGNLAACWPGCLAVALLALDAVVTLARPGYGRRDIAVSDLVSMTAAEAVPRAALIVRASWTDRPEVSSVRRATLSAASGAVLATVAVAAYRRQRRLRWTVAAGGTGMWPQRLPAAERLLDRGSPLGEVEAAAGERLSPRPSAVLRGSEDYQRHLVGVLVGRAVQGAREGTTP
jgi:carbon-monoxide dehydrogenase medium subunit